MKLALAAAAALLGLAAPLASAGVVITPIFSDQVVPKAASDCFFGVTTPSGCAPLRKQKPPSS